ncbi:MAG TPA: putative lipid II flippase FtsW [Dehalococcoidia bacterium]|nr:putative lipid II flippase FtsW [Dehalococcoidia bacterium]
MGRGGALIAASVEIGRERIRAAQPDYLVLVGVAVLTVFGVLIVYSASFAFGTLEFNDGNYFVVRQAAYAVVGGVGMLLAMRMDYRHLRKFSLVLLVASMVLLLATHVPGLGVESNGARRWISVGPLPPLQPSEFVKLALIIYLADWLTSRGDDVRSFTLGVAPFTFVVGPVAALVMTQPDMGTMLILLAITGTQLFVGGASVRHVIALAGATIFGALLLITSGGYRTERLFAFLSPEEDAAGSGFHILQLLIALGSGGLTGVDWGESRQKFFYVPGAHTDGVFAILGEELGFLGGMAVIVIFATVIFRGLRIADRARDPFGHLLAVGIVSWFGYQMLLNIGGITRSIPMTGVPLPFLSYGGSALIAAMTGAGLLLSVSRFGHNAPQRATSQTPKRGAASRAAGSRATSKRRASSAAWRPRTG